MKLVGALLIALASLVAAYDASAPRPNIVVLFADDMGFGDVGFNGNPTVHTPNLDRLAFGGVRMHSWYSAAPVCTPSRGGMMTGRFPARYGLAGDHHPNKQDYSKGPGVFNCNAVNGLPLNETTVAEHLRAANYTTGMIGKWHLGQRDEYMPFNRGFENVLSVPYSDDMGASIFQGQYRDGADECYPLPLFNASRTMAPTVVQQPVIFDDLAMHYADFATNFIRTHAKDPNPFFFYSSFSHVHTAVDADEQWAGPNFWNQSLRGPFGDAATEMDWIVGQILDELDNQNIAEDTLIFFTSDNGPWRLKGLDGGAQGIFSGNYAMLNYNYSDSGKASTWEAGLREPAAIRWPKYVKPGTVSMKIHSTLDIFATSLSLAGVPLPTDRIIDGKDMSQWLVGGEEKGWDFYPYFRNGDLWAIRVGSFKGHWATKSGYGHDPVVFHDPPLIFNVDHDPSEEMAIDPKTIPDIVQQLQQAYDSFNATMFYAPDLLADIDHKYGVCCDVTKHCNCTAVPEAPANPLPIRPEWYPRPNNNYRHDY